MTAISATKVTSLSQSLKKQGKKIVLAGGCFDVLHPGHVIFLEKAKQTGDCLIVLLESDKKVKELKGVHRPVHRQGDRAKILSALSYVDYIVLLPYLKNNSEYDALIKKIKPDVIAVTKGDGDISHHQRAAKLVGASFKFVTKLIGNHSSSKILNR